MSDVDFLLADKHKILLQIDSMIFDGVVKHSKNSQNLQVYKISKKKWGKKFIYVYEHVYLCLFIVINIKKFMKFPTS